MFLGFWVLGLGFKRFRVLGSRFAVWLSCLDLLRAEEALEFRASALGFRLVRQPAPSAREIYLQVSVACGISVFEGGRGNIMLNLVDDARAVNPES